jgi:hypothetical protein
MSHMSPLCINRAKLLSSHGKAAAARLFGIPVEKPRGVGMAHAEAGREHLFGRQKHLGQEIHGDVLQPIDQRGTWSSLAQEYVAGRVRLHFHVGLSGVGVAANPKLYDVCFSLIPAQFAPDEPMLNGDRRRLMDERRRYEGLVLVGVPEFVEVGDKRGVPSLVWLTPLDQCNRLIADAKERSMASSTPVVDPLPAHLDTEPVRWLLAAHRERMFAVGYPTVEDDELTNELGERGSQVMDDLAKDCSPEWQQPWLPVGVEPEDVVAAINVALTDRGPDIRIAAKDVDFLCKRSQFFHSPIPLRPHAD